MFKEVMTQFVLEDDPLLSIIMPPKIWSDFLTLYFSNLLRFNNKTTVFYKIWYDSKSFCVLKFELLCIEYLFEIYKINRELGLGWDDG